MEATFCCVFNMAPSSLRTFCLLYLVLQGLPRWAGNGCNVKASGTQPCNHTLWSHRRGLPRTAGQGGRCNKCFNQHASVYWRRGRKLEHFVDTKRNLWVCQWCRHFWERSRVCQWWRAFAQHCSMYYCDMVAGCHLCACILAAPVAGVGVLLAKGILYMMPTLVECMRCFSEALLLCSMWERCESNVVALLGWLAWTLNLHCACALKCRACTWLVVCLAQRELYVTKLIFMSCLVFWYGKRSVATPFASTNKKQKGQDKDNGTNQRCFETYPESSTCVP